jgi:hypothetical protein
MPAGSGKSLHPTKHHGRREVKRASVTALCLITLTAGLGGGYVFGTRRTTDTVVTKDAVKLSTVKVAQKDLVTYTETTATLGFATSATVSAPISGTVTSLLTSSNKIEAGTVVASIDGAPVVAMYGDTPSYRNLSAASLAGNDIRQLELNLVHLGFDPSHKIIIDSRFDAATAVSVTLFENSVGLIGDGTIAQGEIVFVPGQLLVDALSTSVGGSVNAGSALLVARQTERTLLVASRSGTKVERFAAPSTPVSTGTVLYWSNGFPVMAIVGDAGTTPTLTRALTIGVTNGADIKLLKSALQALDFGPVTVDQHYDAATSTAASAWLGSLGVTSNPASTTIPVGGFVVVPPGLSAGVSVVDPGSTLVGDSIVMSLTAPSRQVTTTAPVGSDTFALGAKINVLFPDGTEQIGTVTTVGNIATTSNQPGSTPSVRISIYVPEIPKSVEAFVEIPVTLRAVSAKAPKAFVVPVSALIALKEGGYAVETVTGTDANGVRLTKLVAVKPGLFSDGFVQVDGSLSDGVEVVVPS